MDLSRIFRTNITTSELEPSQELISSVNDGTTPMLEIVKALGEYLTSTEDDVRLKGLTLLTNIIKKTASSRFNRQATQTLTRFYLSKLDDFDSISPALSALLVLSKLPTFDDDAAVEVYRSIVEQVNMKSYVQAIRHQVYTLFDSFLALHRPALKALGADFLNSYTKMVDGEKDPRNLMLLFAIDKVIILEFDIKEQVEDFFDITFCYFPISFKPPPNDPYGITADDLKLNLRGCMAASPLFAKMAIPLFLEKFATAVGPSMKDLMLSMTACFPVYGAVAVSERGTELWEAIKTEIMYQSDSTIEQAALGALESLIRTIYPDELVPPTGLAQEIIKDCLSTLEDPEKTQSLGATKILVALFTASPSAGKFAISQALPQLFRQFNRPALPSHRTPILWSITSLLIAASKTYGGPSPKRDHAIERAFTPYHTSIMDVLREGLRTENLREPAVRGCVALVEVPGFWSRMEVEDIVRSINDILLNDERQDIRTTTVKGLSTICKIHASIIETTTLPLLFHSLPDDSPGIEDTNSRNKYRSTLNSLSTLSIQPGLFEPLVIRIISKLDILSSIPINDDIPDHRECQVAYAWDLIKCLYDVIDKKIDEKHLDVLRQFDFIVSRLYGLCGVAAAAAGVIGGKEVPIFQDRRLLAMVGRVTERLVWELTTDRQAKLLDASFKAFEIGDWHGLAGDAGKGVKLAGSCTKAGASIPEQGLIIIYSSIIQAIKAECNLPFPSYSDFLAAKINWSINITPDDNLLRWSLDMITALVNHRTTELKDSLPAMMEKIWVSDIQDTSKSFDQRRRALLVYTHVIKALALVRDPLAYESVEKILDILKLHYFDPLLVEEAAKRLGVVAEGKGKGKERGSHLTAKLLWAQKMWGFVLPKIIEGDQEAKGKDRLVYLVAFAALLPLVPASLLLSDLQTILPLILRTMALPVSETRLNAITALTSILEVANMSTEVDKLLHSRAEDMIDGLLRASQAAPETESSAKVRAAALACLASIPDAIRYETLSGQKNRVIKELGKALDDPLRNVRREAVECRARWYQFGRPT